MKITCARTGKQVYTLASAQKHCNRVAARTGVVYRIYRCRYCDYFHLTSQPRRAA
jgi:hypothetical protein